MATNCKVKPFIQPLRACSVSPLADRQLSLEEVAEAELPLYDAIAQENANIAGTDIDLYHLDLLNSTRDRLYDEAISHVYTGPFRMKGYISYPEPIPSAGEEGFRNEWPAEGWIARKELEDVGGPIPLEGDVVRIWDLPFFKEFKVPSSGFYFDVINVNNDGHMADSPLFVGFKLTLKRRTEFSPERKLF